MIEYKEHILRNGLKLIIHEDHSSQLVAVNVLYKVGSRNEEVHKTGFAHLFEHLMFGGSQNIKDFDGPIQLAGGENNAFTNCDFTNFYDVLPAKNIETALWLESDRMKQLDFSEESLEIQRKVVVEEFKETCLNQPYGDAWHHISDMMYSKHAYRWPTIGLDISHIEQAQLSDVKAFFERYYRPNNAILVLSGNIEYDHGVTLAEKWFGDIESGSVPELNLETEPTKVVANKRIRKANVPAESHYMGFNMPGRLERGYYCCDLLSDIMASGRSSRFYSNLYKGTSYFSEIDAYISGSFDPGVFMIESRLTDASQADKAEQAIWKEIKDIQQNGVSTEELEKVKNKVESGLIYSEVNILNKAISLAYFDALGDTTLINKQSDIYQSITTEEIQETAQTILNPSIVQELIYAPNEE